MFIQTVIEFRNQLGLRVILRLFYCIEDVVGCIHAVVGRRGGQIVNR